MNNFMDLKGLGYDLCLTKLTVYAPIFAEWLFHKMQFGSVYFVFIILWMAAWLYTYIYNSYILRYYGSVNEAFNSA